MSQDYTQIQKRYQSFGPTQKKSNQVFDLSSSQEPVKPKTKAKAKAMGEPLPPAAAVGEQPPGKEEAAS